MNTLVIRLTLCGIAARIVLRHKTYNYTGCDAQQRMTINHSIHCLFLFFIV